MAVTITQSPQAVTPSDNPVVWVFSSTQAAQPNFYFFVEVYINGSGTPSSRHVIFVEVNGDTAHFDAEGEKITAYICTNPVPTASTASFSADAANNATISIKVTEYYGTPATAQASATSSTVRVFKSSLSDDNYVDFDNTDYRFSAPITDKKFMTFLPREERLDVNVHEENMFFLINANNNTYDLQVTLYDSNNLSIATDDIRLDTAHFVLMNAGPRSVIANSTITLVNFEAAAYYTIKVKSGITFGETLTIYLDQCNLYETKRLHFLNSLGGIDGFSFTKGNTHNRNITRFGMEKQWGAFNADNEYVFTKDQGREIDYLTNSAGSRQLTSDFITQDIQNWLAAELYETSYCLLEVNEGETLKRVKLTNGQVAYDKASRGELMQAVVDINTSDNRKSSLI